MWVHLNENCFFQEYYSIIQTVVAWICEYETGYGGPTIKLYADFWLREGLVHQNLWVVQGSSVQENVWHMKYRKTRKECN